MPEHHKVSLLLVGNLHRGLVRDALCKLLIKQGSYELAAFLACNLKE